MNIKKHQRVLVAILMVCLCISSCGKIESNDTSSEQSKAGESVVTENSTDKDSVESDTETENNTDTDTSTEAVINVDDMFTERDKRISYDSNGAVYVMLNGDSISCNSKSVSISGTTFTIKDEGCFILMGSLDNGMVIVDAEESDKIQLVLSGANIKSASSAPIYVKNADKVFITLTEETNNTLENGGSFTAIDDNNIDSVIFSKSDLTLNGKGRLTIDSPAGHGIVSKDDLAVTGGDYTINCASHGLSANNSVRITNIAADITAGKDGIQADHDTDASKGFVYITDSTIGITAGLDGISASSTMQIDGGVFEISSGGGSFNGENNSADGFYGGNTSTEETASMKGIKAFASITVNGGKFTLDTADDAVHSNRNITVNAGDFEISTGDDGFHADETLTVEGGVIYIHKSYEGLEALNVLVNNGHISLYASDDGINAAGGTDSSGMGGGFGGDNFGHGGRPQRPGGRMGGGMMSAGNGSIVISGGDIYINASGDGIDANGSLEITGGKTVVCGPTRGDTATLDYDTTATISGGTFIGTGAAGGMAQSFSSSEQAVIWARVNNQSANTEIIIKDSDGNTVITHSPELEFGLVIFSVPVLIKGENYTISIGGIESTVTAN